MPAVDESPSERKHTSSSYRDELAHYKAQYESLEAELADFQSSSRELETEMEKDIEASEKRERQLKEKLDTMRYEVEEWKVCYTSSMADIFMGTDIAPADQIQTVQDGGQCRAKYFAERDHHPPRSEPRYAA